MGLDSIKHIVVLALENRSFDHMLGFLYDQENQPPRGQQFDGLTGNDTNPDANGKLVAITKITNQTPNAYWYPLCNPGEGFANTNRPSRRPRWQSQHRPALARRPGLFHHGRVHP